MKKIWKIIIPLCALVVLLGTGVFLYFNEQNKVENPYLPLDDLMIVTGVYTTEQPEYTLPDSYSEYYVTENMIRNQFCLTKKQKMKINQWLIRHKLEERNNLYQKDFKYKYSYGVILWLDGAPNLTLKRFEYEEERQLKTLYTLQMEIHNEEKQTYVSSRYELTKKEYDELLHLLKKIDLVNETKQMGIMEWRQMEPKAVYVRDSWGNKIVLSQEQLEEVQTFFNAIDDKLTPGYYRTFDDSVAANISSDIMFVNDETYFRTYASVGNDVGAVIHVEGLDNTKAYYAVDEETHQAYWDMLHRFYDSGYPND